MAAEPGVRSPCRTPQGQAAIATAQKLLPLEGLRGVAAAVVLAHHICQTMFYDAYLQVFRQLGPIGRNLLDGSLNGTFAVWLFWVMSAMVLSLKFFRAPNLSEGRDGLADAALRRYPRLAIPVLASVLFAWFLIAIGLDQRGEMIDMFGAGGGGGDVGIDISPGLFDAVRSALWDTFFAYRPSTSYIGVLWTMEKELLGSWFLFGWLALFGRYGRRWAPYAITAIVLCVLSLDWLCAFILGALLCEITVAGVKSGNPTSARMKPFAAAVCGTPFFFVAAPTLLFLAGISPRGPYYMVLACIVTAFALSSKPASRLLSTRPAVFLGKISFGLYLVHEPLINTVVIPVMEDVSPYVPMSVATAAAAAVAILLSIVGGWLLWFFVDRHAVSMSRSIATWIVGTTSPKSPANHSG